LGELGVGVDGEDVADVEDLVVPAGAEIDGGGDSGELVDDLELAGAYPGEQVLVIGGVGLGDVDEQVEGGVWIAIETPIL
jgi:hypothetical protein